MDLSSITIINPKLRSRVASRPGALYRYYAGFSEDFACTLLDSIGLDQGSRVLDPWNGAGTTTSAAMKCGHNSTGFDLNPATVVVAKARSLPRSEFSSILPLADRIIGESEPLLAEYDDDDPLLVWFAPSAVRSLRAIEQAVFLHLIGSDLRKLTEADINALSCMASFFYVALFRSVNVLLRPFRSSNPTWMRRPKPPHRLRPSATTLHSIFKAEIALMTEGVENAPPAGRESSTHLAVGCSSDLAVSSRSVDLVLTSPPYCTRIDYAVATSPELAVLGFSQQSFDALRRRLIGTPTVTAKCEPPSDTWGTTCLRLLEAIRTHSSKASGTYYYRSHLAYFRAIHSSMAEISRVLVSSGIAAIVVQDSYYKNLHNDLPRIFSEMGEPLGLRLARRDDFPIRRSFAGINPAVRTYRRTAAAVESVLLLASA